jgi:regulator of PEP synthase PpsR (kinase-PPPase family)
MVIGEQKRHTQRNRVVIPADKTYPQVTAASLSIKQFHLHLVSDASGETVSSVARACLVQFEGIEPTPHLWWLVRTQGQVERVIEGIEANPGVVLVTLMDGAVRGLLEEACRQLGVLYVPVLDPVMAALAGYLEADFGAQPGRQHALDAAYFQRIDAMHFTLSHDDGQMLHDLDAADVVLVGVSRTSKTPTCMYLANRGLKAANIPLIPGMAPPPELFAAKKPLIVGLTKEPKSLTDIRRSRLRFLSQREESDYADPDRVREEVAMARKLFTQQGWPVIDVSRRSIEEASAAILQLHIRRKGTPT